jgi:HTH-type transcriptional regulator / antitoxin HigA
MPNNIVHPLRTEADYDAALEEIEHYFEHEPKPGTAKRINSTCSR